MRNALTIDVEEYFQAHAYAKVVDRAEWEHLPARVVANVRRLLALLAEHGTRATFFVLGWVADRHPEVVREIAAAGHEVGSHGYAHQLLDRQAPEEFAEDLARSLAAIGRALGRPEALLGYRAPGFSLTPRTLWALDILRAHGIRYDSSLQPLLTRGGNGAYGASRFATRLDAGLWEFPVSTVRLAGYNCPVAGGAWFRLLPLWVTRRAIERINDEGRPAVVYLHPWEVDPEEPVVPGAPLLARVRHRMNLSRTEGRLRRLLGERSFGPLCEVFAAELGRG
ncbi:MAG TPA: XrtA system polysaccharide deacetylase [Verrucomicrobiae bacterium]|nr:XrtA system polysaccharide deacetylase [Verrucomicrobiae bacterium]